MKKETDFKLSEFDILNDRYLRKLKVLKCIRFLYFL